MTDASPERTLALARAASGAVRDLNHAGIDSGPPTPTTWSASSP